MKDPVIPYTTLPGLLSATGWHWEDHTNVESTEARMSGHFFWILSVLSDYVTFKLTRQHRLGFLELGFRVAYLWTTPLCLVVAWSVRKRILGTSTGPTSSALLHRCACMALHPKSRRRLKTPGKTLPNNTIPVGSFHTNDDRNPAWPKNTNSDFEAQGN